MFVVRGVGDAAGMVKGTESTSGREGCLKGVEG